MTFQLHPYNTIITTYTNNQFKIKQKRFPVKSGFKMFEHADKESGVYTYIGTAYIFYSYKLKTGHDSSTRK